MASTYRVKCIARLAFALVKGFFSLTTTTATPLCNTKPTALGDHIQAVVRNDIVRYFEPFANAVEYFRKEKK